MDVINAADRAILERLFGSELPPEFMSECEAAKGVSFDARHASVAIDCLLLNIVHTGIGGGQCIGWALADDGEGKRLDVYRLKVMAEAA